MFFGGSDPFRAAEVLAPLVVDAVDALDLRVVTSEPGVGDRLRALPRSRGQSVTVLAPRPDLLSMARGADVVVTAAGSSVWELMLHGIPFACLQIADNQQPGYRALIDRKLGVGLGSLEALRRVAGARRRARSDLASLAGDPELRAALAVSGRGLLDGRGRARVVDALLPWTQELHRPPSSSRDVHLLAEGP
jgi:spore coat polysaccharide biosynthesis predicted glycosyltransferase SpsG